MSASNFLSLDQALQTTGWAVFKNNELVGHGTYQIPADKGMETRLGLMFAELNKLYKEYEFDFIVFEGIQNQQNAETFKRLAYVQAAIMLWCYFENIGYEILTPSEWRSKLSVSFGKKREEQKKKAMELVSDVFNVDVSSDEADAICIGLAHQKSKTCW